MKNVIPFGLVGLMMLATPAMAQTDVLSTSYTCDRGASVNVTYVTSGEDSLAVVSAEGNQVALKREVSASGEKFGAGSAEGSYVWWANGTEATLYWGTAPDEATLLNCKQKS